MKPQSSALTKLRHSPYVLVTCGSYPSDPSRDPPPDVGHSEHLIRPIRRALLVSQRRFDHGLHDRSGDFGASG